MSNKPSHRCEAYVQKDRLAMRSRPFGAVSADNAESRLSAGSSILVVGWIQIDGGPKWFRIERIAQQFLWVSGYTFENNEVVRTLATDMTSCDRDIYDSSMELPLDTEVKKDIERQLRDNARPFLKGHHSDRKACFARILVDNIKVYDTPFEEFQGERDYGELAKSTEVLFTGWFQTDSGTKWLRIASWEQFFWIKGIEYVANKDQLVLEATDQCEVDDLYREDYRLVP